MSSANSPMINSGELEAWVGQEVVLDLAAPFVTLGRLTAVSALWLELSDADVHDLRDTKTSRELYVVEARKHGIRTNRKRVLVNRQEVVCLSRLVDVLS